MRDALPSGWLIVGDPDEEQPPRCTADCAAALRCPVTRCPVMARRLRAQDAPEVRSAYLAESNQPHGIDELEAVALAHSDDHAKAAMFALAWAVSPLAVAALTRLSHNGVPQRRAVATQCLAILSSAAQMETSPTYPSGRPRTTGGIAVCGFSSTGKSSLGLALGQYGCSVVEPSAGVESEYGLDVANGPSRLGDVIAHHHAAVLVIASPYGHQDAVTVALATNRYTKLVLDCPTDTIVQRLSARTEFRPYASVARQLGLDFFRFVHAVRVSRHAGYLRGATLTAVWRGGSLTQLADYLVTGRSHGL
jgi:hypothetical protein